MPVAQLNNQRRGLVAYGQPIAHMDWKFVASLWQTAPGMSVIIYSAGF
jgi:hypothetical protein